MELFSYAGGGVGEDPRKRLLSFVQWRYPGLAALAPKAIECLATIMERVVQRRDAGLDDYVELTWARAQSDLQGLAEQHGIPPVEAA